MRVIVSFCLQEAASPVCYTLAVRGGLPILATNAAPLGADAAPPGANTAQAVRGGAIGSHPEACGLLPTFANMAKYH